MCHVSVGTQLTTKGRVRSSVSEEFMVKKNLKSADFKRGWKPYGKRNQECDVRYSD